MLRWALSLGLGLSPPPPNPQPGPAAERRHLLPLLGQPPPHHCATALMGPSLHPPSGAWLQCAWGGKGSGRGGVSPKTAVSVINT